MQRLTRNKEIKQPNSEISFPSLNGGQRNVIEGTLNFYLDDIHDLTKEGSERKLHPLNALKALKKMLNTEPLNEEEVKQFTKHDILTNITVVRDILNHPYPQNRTHSYFPTGEKDFVLFHLNPDDCDKLLDKQATLNTKRTIQTEDQTRVVYDVIYKNGRKIPANLTHSLTSLDSLGIEWDFIGKEPIGKLSLTNLEDAKTLPVTKQAVVDYIHFLVKKAIKFQEMQYIEDIKKFLQIKSFIKIIHADTILEIAKEGGVECAIFLLKTQGIIEKLEYSHLKKIESFYPNTTVSVFLKTVVYKNYFNMLVNSDRFNLNTLRKVTEILNKCEALQQTYPIHLLISNSQSYFIADFDTIILRRYMRILELIQFVDKNCEIDLDKLHNEDIKKLYQSINALLKSAKNYSYAKFMEYKKMILNELSIIDPSTIQHCIFLTKQLSTITFELNALFIKMMPSQNKYMLRFASAVKDSKEILPIKKLSPKEQYTIDIDFCRALNEKQYDSLQKLLEKGANIEQCYDNGYKPLMSCIVNSDETRIINDVHTLLNLSANPNDQLNDNNRIIFSIEMDAHATPLILLLCRDIHFNKTTRAVADLLLKFGADINAVTKKLKMTVLHYAVQLKASSWILYLVEKGADITLENHIGQGLTPAAMANMLRHRVIHPSLTVIYTKIWEMLSKITDEALILDNLNCYFKKDLQNLSLKNIEQALKQNNALARFRQKKSLPPVFLVIPHAIFQPKTIDNIKSSQILDLLKKYNADFNATYFVDSYFGLEINCFINPLAWCLLHSSDNQLFEKLVAYGADEQHPSINKIAQLMIKNKEQYLNQLYENKPTDISTIHHCVKNSNDTSHISQTSANHLSILPFRIHKSINSYLGQDYKTLTGLSRSCRRLYSLYQPAIDKQPSKTIASKKTHNNEALCSSFNSKCQI